MEQSILKLHYIRLRGNFLSASLNLQYFPIVFSKHQTCILGVDNTVDVGIYIMYYVDTYLHIYHILLFKNGGHTGMGERGKETGINSDNGVKV